MRYLILICGNLAVGAAAIFARWALEGAGAVAVSALRLAIAALAVRAISAVLKPSGTLTRAEERLLAFAGIALAAHFATWIASLQYLSVATATLLVCSTPLWTSLYEAIVLKRSPAPVAWAAMAGGAIGVVMLINGDTTAPPIPGSGALGACLALAGSVMIGAYLFMVREIDAGVSTWVIVSRTYTWAAIVLALAALMLHQAAPISNGRAWVGILAMALLSQLCGHTLFNLALRYVAPSTIAFSTLLEPVFAAALAVVLFSERLPFAALAGGLLILVCVAIVLRSDRLGERALINAEPL